MSPIPQALEQLAARRFVARLAASPPEQRHPVLPPLLHRDPYLSAWINVESSLAYAAEPVRDERVMLASTLDREIALLDLAPEVAEAARRAIRAILARPWLLTPESFQFVYQPFEVLIPVESLYADP